MMLNSKDGHGVIYEDLSVEEQVQEQLSNGPLWREYQEYLQEEDMEWIDMHDDDDDDWQLPDINVEDTTDHWDGAC